MPSFLANISYDQCRMLRFDKNHALWRGTKKPYQVEFFHRGSIYKGRVNVNEVVDGRSTPFRYNPDEFSFGTVQRPTNEDLGFAGFRLHAAINRPDYFDQVCAFLGASYFRAVAKGLGYGLSARGLAIKTADPGGEEFPSFKTFWIERPKPGLKPGPITVHALLDSQKAAAVFRFVITPGVDTVFDTAVTLFPAFPAPPLGGDDDWGPRQAAALPSDAVFMASRTVVGGGDQTPSARPRSLRTP